MWTPIDYIYKPIQNTSELLFKSTAYFSDIQLQSFKIQVPIKWKLQSQPLAANLLTGLARLFGKDLSEFHNDLHLLY